MEIWLWNHLLVTVIGQLTGCKSLRNLPTSLLIMPNVHTLRFQLNHYRSFAHYILFWTEEFSSRLNQSNKSRQIFKQTIYLPVTNLLLYLQNNMFNDLLSLLSRTIISILWRTCIFMLIACWINNATFLCVHTDELKSLTNK